MNKCEISGRAAADAELYLFERDTLRAAGLVCVRAGGRFIFEVESDRDYLLLAEPVGVALEEIKCGAKSLALC